MKNNDINISQKAILFIERPAYNLGFDLAIDPENQHKKVLLIDSDDTETNEVSGFDEVFNVSLMDLSALNILIEKLQQKYDIKTVLSTSEISVVTGAYIADKLGIDDVGFNAALKCRNKFHMSKALIKGNISAPNYFLLKDASQIDEAIEQLGGFPVICKPLMGFASQGVIKADNYNELLQALGKIRRENNFVMRRYYLDDESNNHILLQQYISGPEYAIDGYIAKGNTKLLTIAEKPYTSSGPYFEDNMHIMPANLPAELQQKIADIAHKTVIAVGLDNSTFHIEVKLNNDGLFVIEIGARIGFITCLELLHGINTCELNYALKQGKPPSITLKNSYVGSYCMTPDRRGRFQKIANIDDIAAHEHIAKVNLLAAPNSLVLPPPNGNSYIGIVFAKASSYAEVKAALDWVSSNAKIIID